MSHGHNNDHYGEAGATHAPVPLDPEHDIDARSATIWVVGGAIVLFISLWVMVPIFVLVQEKERERKIYEAPTVELDEAKARENKFLGVGTEPDNPTHQKIANVLAKMAQK